MKTQYKLLQPNDNKSQSNSQSLMLELMSEMINQQKQSNQLLRLLVYGQNIYHPTNPLKTDNHHKIKHKNIYNKTLNTSSYVRQNSGKLKTQTTQNQLQIQQIKQDNENESNKKYFSSKLFSSLNQMNNNFEYFKKVTVNRIPKSHQAFEDLYHQQQIQKHNNNVDNHQMIENQKHYYRLSKIQPYADRRETKIRINFIDILRKSNIQRVRQFNQINMIISQWLGIVYRVTASICWNMVNSKTLTYEETKILFTENIIYNYIELMKDIQVVKDKQKIGHTKDLEVLVTDKINTQSVSVLKYLSKQYPQTKIEAPNMSLREITPQIDEKGKIQYEMVSRSKIIFQYNSRKDYVRPIMAFINYLIDVTDQQFTMFQKYFWKTFQTIFIPPQQRKDLLDNLKVGEDTFYRDKVKKITKYMIGRKIPKNTQRYSVKEIENGIFFIKSAQIMRVIAKWVQELTNIVEDPKKMIRDWYYPFKKHDGSQISLEYSVRNGLYNIILQERQKLLNNLKQIQKFCFEIECKLTDPEFIQGQKLGHLSQQQINVGLFASNMKNSLSEFLFMQLIELIHFLLKIPKLVDQTNLNLNGFYFQKEARSQLDSVNLVSFRIFDLLRCKCISGEDQTIYLMNLLNQRNKISKANSSKPQLRFVRVKDRLGQGSRDILINAQLHDGLVFEIQLSIASQVEEKQQNLDKYNHFLYQLRRSTFLGPLIENVSIWTSLEQRASFFDEITKKKFKQSKNKAYHHQCFNSNMTRYSYPIVCVSCRNFYDIARTCLLNLKCRNCGQTVCGQCLYLGYSEIQRKKLLFNQIFSDQFIQTLEQYQNKGNYQDFPEYSFFIPKILLKKQLFFFKSYKPIENYRSQEIAHVVINRKMNKIISKGYLTQKQSNTISIDNLLVFKINPQYIKICTFRELKQLVESGKYTKILKVCYQPNFIQKMNEYKSKKDLTKLLYDLEMVLLQKNLNKIIVIIFNNMLTICQVFIEDQELRIKLTRRHNLFAIEKLSKINSSIICLQHKKLTNQFDENMIDKRISRKIFQNLCQNVTKLYLNYSQIKNISSIRLMKKLEIFSISHNNLNSLEGLQGLQKLKIIHFDSNNVSSLQPLQKLVQLNKVIANNNVITSLKGIQNLTNLKQLAICNYSLKLVNNLVENIEHYLDNLKSIEVIYMRKNKLTQFNQLSNLATLKSISLSQNPFNSIGNLKCFANLTTFSSSSIGLTKIPSNQIMFISLVDLSLHDNFIQKIQGLQNQKKLKYLGMNNNKITKIEGLVGIKLEKLYLQNNQIKVIQGIDSFMDSLQQLKIRNNPIEDIGDLRNSLFQFKIEWSYNQFSNNAANEMIEATGSKPMFLSIKMIKQNSII